MKFAPIPLLVAILALGCSIAWPVSSAEFREGQKVWSKHHETALLTEPSPLADVAATVGFAEKLSIKEVSGAWLRVRFDGAEGWVFTGNIATEKPSLAPAAGFTTVDASQTDTVAAARPLTPAADQYARKQGAGDAQADIHWLDAESSTVRQPDIVAYMVENRKGEYQE